MALISELRSKGIGLALGGGAARGLAHIGVLRVLEEEGIPVRYVAGTSVGSVIGAAFCGGFGWKDLGEMARAIDWRDIASLTFPRRGLMSTSGFERLLNRYLNNKTFGELGIPLAVVAVDLISEQEVVIRSGPVASAVRASCAIPGIFEPVVKDGQVLVDGGLRNNVPADVVRDMGAEFVIGIDLNADTGHDRPPKGFIDVLHYTFDILVKHGGQGGLRAADLVVRPSLRDFGYQDLHRLRELVSRGDSAMRAALEAYKQ